MVCLGPRDPGEIVGPRPLSDVGARPLNFTVRRHLVESPSTLEKAVRFGCGFVFGCFAGLLGVLSLITWKGHYIVAGCALGGLLCGVAAMKYGDRFWLRISRITSWGFYWRW